MRSGRLSSPFVPSILKPNFVAMADLVADRGQSLADQLLVRVGPVDFGRVEECDTSFVGFTNHADALGPVHAGAHVAAGQGHVAEAEFRYLQCTEASRFHKI